MADTFVSISIPSVELAGTVNIPELLNVIGPAVATVMRNRIRSGLDAFGDPFPPGMTFVDTGRFVRSIRADKVRKAKPGQPQVLAVSIGPRGPRPEARGKRTITGGRDRGGGRSAKRAANRVARNIDIAMFWAYRTRGTRVVLIGLREQDERMVRGLIQQKVNVSITVISR